MKLLTKAIEAELRANSARQGEALQTEDDINFKPALKLFNPLGAGTWLLTELDEDGRLFGLCDPGQGTPELGYVALAELEAYRGPLGLGIERDKWFTADKPLSEYAEEARNKGRIAA